ncbi:MAG: hypothetical protein A2Z96_03245 [Spirochaetes bacterium GWB1_48_6]|nr:MAG: hypothetical protein A2Z96_03245 [Spirochaetes bacterium GWB1_48_6]
MNQEYVTEFDIHTFVLRFFEDLSLTLPSLGCKFQGDTEVFNLAAVGDPNWLKNKLFLIFFDLANIHKEMNFKFAISHRESRVHFFFRSTLPLSALDHPESLNSWDSTFFRVESQDGWANVLTFDLPVGKAIFDASLPFDRRKALELYLQPETVEQVLKTFLSKVEEWMTNLDIAIEKGDHWEVFRLSHSLKGGARNIFALPLAAEAGILESRARIQDLTEAPQMYAKIRRQYQELMNFLHAAS